MFNAPSVSYPVGRCAFQRNLYLALVVLTAAVGVTWVLQQGWRDVVWAAFVLSGLGAYMGWSAWRQGGRLTWDGRVWCLHAQVGGQADALGEVFVALDVQKALLLRWQPTSDTLHRQPRWLWLGWHSQQSQEWQALRRAVYQSQDNEMKETT